MATTNTEDNSQPAPGLSLETASLERETNAIDLILTRLTDFAHSLGKMEGMLSRALATGRLHGERIKALEATSDEHAHRLVVLEQQAHADRKELDGARSVVNNHAVRMSQIETKSTHWAGWRTGVWTAITMAASIGGGVAALVIRRLVESGMWNATQ